MGVLVDCHLAYEHGSVIPWSVETLDHSDVDHWQGTLDADIVNVVVSELTEFVVER